MKRIPCHFAVAAFCALSACTQEDASGGKDPTPTEGVASPQSQPNPISPITDYRLTVGETVPVCEALLQRFKSLAAPTPTYDMCDVPIDPNDPQFSQPTWVVEDYKNHLDLLATMFVRAEYNRTWRYIFHNASRDGMTELAFFRTKYWEPLKPRFLAGFTEGKARLEKAYFDIDNDGKSDVVYRATYWDVLPAPQENPAVAVEQRAIKFSDACFPGQTKYKYFLERELPEKFFGIGLSRYLHSDGYVFLYNGTTYFGISPDTFGKPQLRSPDPSSRDRLFALTGDAEGSEAICSIVREN